MLNAIRKSIANLIAPTAIVVEVPKGARSVTSPNAPAHLLNQSERQHQPEVLPGLISLSDIDQLSSEYLRDSLYSLGAWSALARAFGEYERVIGKRAANDEKLNALLEEFHAWNAATSTTKQMGEEQLILTIAKMATVAPQKGNNETDKIIARVRKVSVEELRDQREAQALKDSARREELISGFVANAWSFSGSNINPTLTGTKAVTKAIQTMDFVATKWTGNPANIAGELLLMEADLLLLERIAAAERQHEGQGDYDMQQ